jgi:nuclear GTP-binding protein
MGKSKSQNSNNVNRKAEKGNTHMRSKSTIMRLNMTNSKGPIRNKQGKVVGGDYVMKNRAGGELIKGQARIAPDRRWFGNTRVIGQNELDTLREQVSIQNSDPYAFVLRRKKIPMSLLQDDNNATTAKVGKMNVLENESYDSVFGKTFRIEFDLLAV